jgi:hypothetical protein
VQLAQAVAVPTTIRLMMVSSQKITVANAKMLMETCGCLRTHDCFGSLWITDHYGSAIARLAVANARRVRWSPSCMVPQPGRLIPSMRTSRMMVDCGRSPDPKATVVG